jgi:cytosine/adenosine deaminase-related metal-dependent hydrolase
MTRRFLANGTTRFRTHVDVDTEIGLAGIEGVMAARAALAPLVEMQIVAFPQSGMLVRPGTVELLDRALALGAEVVGGLDPSAIDRDPKGHLDTVFALSQTHGRPIDIHLHEPGELGAFAIELMLERVRALGMQGRLVVSHAFCLGDLPERQSEAMMDAMAQLGIAIATTATPARVVPSLVKARAAGIPVFAGNDGIRDTWGPYGVPDMLQRAMIVGMRNNLRRDDEVKLALEAVSTEGARGCGFADYGLAPGDRADLVLVPAETVAEAVVAQPPRTLVVAAGRVVARDGALVA